MSSRRLLFIAVVALMSALAVPTEALAVPSVPSSKFEPAQNCGCHAGFMDLWSQSMHAQALSDPLYQAKLAEANRATKGALGPFCNSCHTPIGVMSGEAKSGKFSDVARQGITCDFCHQVTGTQGKLGNASWTIDANGTKRAQLKDAKSPSHAVAYSDFHTESEICGTCHNVDHPANGMHLEATYTEWSKSPYAKQGITCQDCHMTPGPGVTKPSPGQACAMGPQRQHIYHMQFVGANTALGGPKDVAMANLQKAAEIGLETTTIVEPGQSFVVTASVTNVGAGHYLPTGLTEVRQMWLEVVGTDASGAEVLRERHDYGTVLRDAKGKYPVELWDAVAIQSDDRILPLQTKSYGYEARMPESGPVTVTATLYYRSAPEELAEKAGVDVPTEMMTSAETVVYGSEEQLRETVGDPQGPGGFGSTTLLLIAVLGMLALGGVIVWGIVRARKTP